ncbi:MAG: fumarylacetoacetate hydrolase family protein [Rhodospirillales bacterium]|jgi:2-keto-4-pentenoate hydratase/2-oxohepta-3-ene-1,7-dioic acid hydratase in catechol pathway|nr:fumarylacetoacetate hydrolase family protein [Rhodospirillales bacterium]
MKLMSFRRPDGSASWGIVKPNSVVDLGHLAPSLKHALWATTSLAEEAARHPDLALDQVRFLPPIPDPDKIICVGLNYMTHIKEGGREPPAKPIIFTRFANSQVGHGDSLIRPSASETYDFEGELAVIIGRRCRHVKKADAASVIAGYSCYNEGSVREWQRHSAQFTPGKNFFHSGAFGPWIATPEEVGDITKAHLVTRLNGEEVQHATIDDLCFDIPTLIAYISTFTRLEAGDVIVTGTTGGVGAYRKPPLWMKPGDTVEVEVTGVGLLRNTVAAEA